MVKMILFSGQLREEAEAIHHSYKCTTPMLRGSKFKKQEQ